ncbi:PglL family O-oligosaccharyltransferase [Pseudomonas tohonis]|uniref:PglL family O-oligosaccharyltransferase n=1 Tax=Pseudomonas tohonis TaxID=2725477 RepID=UPI0021DA8856|nr:Wzy polymerase domain-containing protein [Pseudomonas tohonis]UXY54012.1 Wzy polymerase domain-containing protein [Pseudomonas tohonis]
MPRSIAFPVFSFLLVMLSVSFSNPLHVFPLLNYNEELFAACAVVAGAAVLVWCCRELRFSLFSALWLALGCVFLLSAMVSPATFVSGKLGYLLYWFIGALALLVGEQLDWNDFRASDRLAWILLLCSLFGSVLGGLRHFGLLWSGFDGVIPKVPSDRMIGFIGQSNYFGHICLVGILSAAWLFNRRKLNTVILVLGAIPCISGLLLSGSRSALLAWFCVVLLLWGRDRVMSRYKVAATLGLLATLALMPVVPDIAQWLAQFSSEGILDGRLMAIGQRGVDSPARLLEWKIAFDVWMGHPWLGVGVGNYAAAGFDEHIRQGISSSSGLFTHSHNIFLQLSAETGVPGILWCLIFGVIFCVYGWRACGSEAKQLPVSILLIFSVYSLLEFPLWIMPFLVLSLLLLGVLADSAAVIRLRLAKGFSLVLSCVFLVMVTVYVPLMERFYWSFRQYLVRAPVKVEEYDFMTAMIRDPLMEPAGYLIYFANFQLSAKTVVQEREVLERFRRYLPYPPVMARLAVVQVAMGDVEDGRRTVMENRLYYGNAGIEHFMYAIRDEAESAFPDTDFSVLFTE